MLFLLSVVIRNSRQPRMSTTSTGPMWATLTKTERGKLPLIHPASKRMYPSGEVRRARFGPGLCLALAVRPAGRQRHPWTLLVKRLRKVSRGVTRRWLRRRGSGSSGSRARSRPAGWTAPAARRHGPGRGRAARRRRRGRRVRPSGRFALAGAGRRRAGRCG